MKQSGVIAAFLFIFVLGNSFSDILPKSEQPGTFVVPGQEGMHRELIPKSITIVHCSYDLDVVAPGTTFNFDLIGSGFDEAFYKIISVDPDALDITVKNLRLVTPNQIHGQIDVGSEATTQYIHPLVVIRSLPVFRAPEPFGVVRPGEVLDIELTSIDETGQWGRFRVITNLDDRHYQQFHLEPTNELLEVSNLKAQLPFYVDGVVMIGQGLKHGHYGLVATLGKREVFRQDPLVDVVKPTVGKTGSIEKVEAVEKAHRPGDNLELMIKGSAFLPTEISLLSVHVTPTDMGPANLTYVSPGRVDATLRIPPNAAVGVYGVNVLSNGKVLQEQLNVFGIVPPNWLASVKLVTPLSPGKNGQLQILGRDITPEFMKTLTLETDTEGIKVSNLRWQDPMTLVADIAIAADVAPGDYLIHVSEAGKPLKFPRGNIIKVMPF
jgi:hypothetical protein